MKKLHVSLTSVVINAKHVRAISKDPFLLYVVKMEHVPASLILVETIVNNVPVT